MYCIANLSDFGISRWVCLNLLEDPPGVSVPAIRRHGLAQEGSEVTGSRETNVSDEPEFLRGRAAVMGCFHNGNGRLCSQPLSDLQRVGREGARVAP